MATQSADDIAELRALLETCCAELASLSDTAFLRSAEGAVPGAGPGRVATAEEILAGSAGPRWRPLLVGLPPGVGELASILKPPISAITAVLQALSAFLDILRALLIGIPDPFEALIKAAIAALEAIINDLLQSGGYLYYDAPGLSSPQVALAELGLDIEPGKVFHAGERNEARPARAVDNFERWAGRFSASFDDPGDAGRPQFSEGASIEAIFIVAAAPSLAELAQLVWLLGNLLNIEAFKRAFERFVEGADDASLARVAQRSVAPDWYSKKLHELLPPLRKLAELPELLRGLLGKLQSVIDLLADLAAAVQEKVNLLLEMAQSIQDIIDLLDALSSAGLHILPVATNEGVAGLERAFVEAANRPPGGFVAGACLLAGGPGLKDAAFLWEIFAGGAFAKAGSAALEQLEAAGAELEAAGSQAAQSAEDAWNDMVDAVEAMPAEVSASLGRGPGDLLDALHNAPRELYDVLSDARDVHVGEALEQGRERARELSKRGARSMALYTELRPDSAEGPKKS